MSLTDLSKNKILQTLPLHFVNENADELIRRIDELKDNNWCLYIYYPDRQRGDSFLHFLEYTTKEQIKSSLIEYISNRIKYDSDTIADYCNTLKKNGLLPPKDYSNATTESLSDLTIEDYKDYLIAIGCIDIAISCHTKYLKDLFFTVLRDS